MAINYNLAKVYALSDSDPHFVKQIITLFIKEVPQDMKQIDIGIKAKDYKLTHAHAHKIKPSLDLLGMSVAFEEIILVETWSQKEGKRKEIVDTFQSIHTQVEKAVKEMKKDFEV